MFDPLVQVDVCGVSMSTGAASFGAEWWVEDIQGWDSPGMRTASTEPTSKHGRPQSTALYDGREITVEGHAIATTRADAMAAHKIVRGSMPGLARVGLLVVHEDPVVWLEVKQNHKPVAPSPRNGSFGFTLNLIADVYPFKRAMTARTVTIGAGASADLTNDGDFEAALVIETSGTLQLRRDDTDQLMQTRVDVAAGTVFDTAARTVTTSGGLAIFPMASPSEWLFAAAETDTSFTNLGADPVDITWYDTYI